MFNIGDLIVYGNHGVCKVENIGPPELSGMPQDRDYYTLVQYYSDKTKFFTPCDNQKVVMRRVISREEAQKIVDDIEDIELLDIPNEKARENIYKDTMNTCNCRSFVSIIKTIYVRKQERLAEGKKFTASDEKYFNMAEDKLIGELAIALGINKDKVKDYITEKVGSTI